MARHNDRLVPRPAKSCMGPRRAAGRLEDKSSLVRKEALKLLGVLMNQNPFGGTLPEDRFAASLAVHRAMLEQLQPASPADEMAAAIVVEGGGGPAPEGEGAGEEGGVVKAEPEEGGDAAMETEEGAAPEAAAAAAEEEEEAPAAPARSRE